MSSAAGPDDALRASQRLNLDVQPFSKRTPGAELSSSPLFLSPGSDFC